MKKFLQIQDGLVFICGPSTSGKTTLAQKIYEKAPYRNKVWISHDRILVDFIKTHGYSEEAFYDGLPEEDDAEFRGSIIKALIEAFSQRKFVVFEGLYCDAENDAERLGDFLCHIPFFGLERPITLLKMLLPYDLHSQFLHNRLTDIDIDWPRLATQRREAERFIEPGYYSREMEWVKEYSIDDPREIELEFRKAGELSKELVAAFAIHEEISERFGDISQYFSEIS